MIATCPNCGSPATEETKIAEGRLWIRHSPGPDTCPLRGSFFMIPWPDLPRANTAGRLISRVQRRRYGFRQTYRPT